MAGEHRRYFLDRFPISILPETQHQLRRVSFCFVDDGTETFGPFWRFLLCQEQLLRSLPSSEIVHVGDQKAFYRCRAYVLPHFSEARRYHFPGFAYQLGVLVSSPAVSIQYALRNRLGYSWTLALLESIVILSLIILLACGPERKGRSFHA
jgi:hypothetical protein